MSIIDIWTITHKHNQLFKLSNRPFSEMAHLRDCNGIPELSSLIRGLCSSVVTERIIEMTLEDPRTAWTPNEE